MMDLIKLNQICMRACDLFKSEESISFKISKNKKFINIEDFIKQKIFDEDETINYVDIALFILLTRLRNTVLFTRKK